MELLDRFRLDPRLILAGALALLLLIAVVAAFIVMRGMTDGGSEPPPAVETSPVLTEYVVEDEDTVSDVAARLDVPVEALRAINELGESDLLDAGQVLLVPPAGIVVQEADASLTVRELARIYDLEPFTLAAYNGIVRDLVDVPLGRNVVILPEDSSEPTAP